MSFKYPVCTRELIDIDDLIEKWNESPDVVNPLCHVLTQGEYALINFIVNEGLKDIRGQEPDIEEPDDDPFGKPNPDYGIENPILDEDPFATPVKWTREYPGIYDPETKTVRNTLGQILWSAEMSPEASPVGEYPYTQDWIEFYLAENPEEKKVIFPPLELEDPYYDSFMAYLETKYGNQDIGIEPIYTIEEI